MLNDRAPDNALAQWSQRLDEHPLPVLPDSARALQQALKLDDASLHDLGTIMASDPVMSLLLLRECQRQFGQRVEGSLTNIHHAVAMLGLDKTQLLARTFTPLSEPLTSHQHYLDALGCALHGAEQVRHWIGRKQAVGADSLYLAALLLGLVDAALWHFAPREMHALAVLTGREAIPDDEADLAVLGCTRPQLARALAERWRFPAPVLEAILPNVALPSPAFLLRHARRAERNPLHKLPNRSANGELIRTPALYVRLARLLASQVQRDWYSRTLQRCHSVLAACLFFTPAEARQLTTETAVELSQQWPIPLTQAPAAGLLWPLQPRQRRRIKPAQLPKAVAQLLAGSSLPAAAATSTARQPGAPRSAGAQPSPPAPRPTPPPKIGLTSRNLPEDLDRNSILNAPLPGAPAAAPARFPGFRSLQKKQEFEQFLQRLLTEPDCYDTEFAVVRAVVEHLHDCTELTRVVASLYNPKLDQLEAYFALGCEQYPGLKRFRVRLQPVNLFTHLLKQPAGLWLSPDRPNKATGLIPGSFKQASQSDTCFLMSVFDHKGPHALFYADRGLGDRLGLSEHEYSIFKSACTACSKHLINKGKRAAVKKTDP